MTATSESGATTRTCHVFIKATPDAVWHAITATRWNQKTGYQSAADHDSPASGLACPPDGNDVVIVGDVVAAEPPRRLVQTWRTLPLRRGGPATLTRLTWKIEESPAGVTVLTLTRQRDGALRAGSQVPDTGAGWCRLLSDVKTTLETGVPLAGLRPDPLHVGDVSRPGRLTGRALDGIASVSARVRTAWVRLTQLTRLLAYRPPATPPQTMDTISRALGAVAADRADTGWPQTSRAQLRAFSAGSAHGTSMRTGDDSWQGRYLRVPAPRDPGADARG